MLWEGLYAPTLPACGISVGGQSLSHPAANTLAPAAIHASVSARPFFPMKKIVALLATLTVLSLGFAAAPAKSTTPEKSKGAPKSVEMCGDDACCDEDAAKPAADAKTAKATEQKADAAKKDAAKTVAKSDKK
jgi:hypothetical protein